MNRSQRRAATATGQWVPLVRAVLVPRSRQKTEELVKLSMENAPAGMDEARVREIVESTEDNEVWRNDRYQVHVIPWPPLKINGRQVPVVQLSIRRLDRAPVRDWRDVQQIKTELLGAECEGIELYPAESRRVDTANQYHVWVVTDPRFRFPFGWDAGRVVSGKSGGGSVQRPLD